MSLKRYIWNVSKFFFLAGALAATYLVSATVAMRVALKAREVPVPPLIGRTVTDATELLAKNSLVLQVEEGRRMHPSIEAGQVMAQEPNSGLTLRRQRNVRVWISSGPRADTVPVLIGETPQSAQVRLARDSLNLTGVSEIRSSLYPTGAIVAQDPLPNSPGSSVSILVNRGELGAAYVMPDLIGVNGNQTAEILRSTGLRVTIVGDHPYPGVPSGVILRQHPPAGFQIRPGESISLEVSR
jgi:beta-lactam-binding protein with PASTA domain